MEQQQALGSAQVVEGTRPALLILRKTVVQLVYYPALCHANRNKQGRVGARWIDS